MNFTQSQCRGTWLHKWALIDAHPDAILERCTRCGKKQVTKLYKGNPDAVNYARSHMREFLVPQHRLYAKEYPKV